MTEFIQNVKHKISERIFISKEEAKKLFLTATDEELCSLAQEAKKNWNHSSSATYLIMAIVNYTNICVAMCDYCAFYRLPHSKEGYLLTLDQVSERIEKLKTFGGTLISFNGGFHPKLKITDYAEFFKSIHARFPELEFFEMTVAEFMFSCKLSKVSYAEGAKILRDAGTHWVTGGGAEVLDDAFRKRHSPGKYSVADYYSAQKAILESGLGSTATMVIGFDESLEERFNHLESLRTFQTSVNGKLPSFLVWTYKPWNTQLGGSEVDLKEYLRWLAVCRIYLDNFKHIRTSVLTRNEDALLGLNFGADDFDLPTEDEVTQKAGATISHEFEKILSVAKQEGYQVKKRSPWSIHESRPLDC